MSHLPFVDCAIREYLLFRGFSMTLKSFDTELKAVEKSSVEKMLEKIQSSVQTQDFQSLRELWRYLAMYFFNKLDLAYSNVVKRIEANLLKLYLVQAHSANKPDKISELFAKSPELQSQSEWKDWFAFPFCKNPEDHPVFSVYFSKQWQDTFMVSLHNFLATIFQCMPMPLLARIDSEAAQIRKLQEENMALREHIEQTIAATSPSGQSSSSASSHQSRLSTFNDPAQVVAGIGGTKERSTFYSSRATSGSTTSSAATTTATTSSIAGPSSSSSSHHQHTHSSQHHHHHHHHHQHHPTLDDIVPYPIATPKHIVDDFSTIAQESITMNHVADTQLRGLKLLIRNIGNSSPTQSRKEGSVERNKKRSGSAGPRSWITKD